MFQFCIQKRNKKCKSYIIAGFITACILCFFCGCGKQTEVLTSAEEDGSAYVLPVVLPLSGELAYLGEDARWAVDYATEQINASGGVNGIPVKASFYDSESNENTIRDLAKNLSERERFYIGPIDSVGTAAQAEIILENQTPNVAAYSYEALRSQAAPYGISYMSDSTEGETAAIEEWKKLNPDIESVVIFVSKDENSQMETAEALSRYLPELSMTVEAVISIDSSDHNGMSAVVEALNTNADGYIILARAIDYGNIVSELRKRGISDGWRFTASFASFDTTLISSHRDALIGTYIWNKFDVDYAGTEWQALLTAYMNDHNGNKPDYNIVPDVYNAVFAWEQCIETLELSPLTQDLPAEKAAISEWFYHSPVLHGIQGDYQWIDGNKKSSVYYFQFDNGGMPVSVNHTN